MDWQTITLSILSSGVVAALITAMVNGLMNYRTQIRAIRESGLYTKRANVLDEMMKRMECLDRIAGELVSFFQNEVTIEDENKRRQDAMKALNYFVDHYKRSRHYLPKKLSEGIGGLCGEYKELFVSFMYEARLQGKRPDIKKWQELMKKYQEEFPEKREKVADEFRKIIGVK